MWEVVRETTEIIKNHLQWNGSSKRQGESTEKREREERVGQCETTVEKNWRKQFGSQNGIVIPRPQSPQEQDCTLPLRVYKIPTGV
jgi:hypothetical protein